MAAAAPAWEAFDLDIATVAGRFRGWDATVALGVV
jgi:hypothetical protein